MKEKLLIEKKEKTEEKINVFRVFIGVMVGVGIMAVFAFGYFYGEKLGFTEEPISLDLRETFQQEIKDYKPVTQQEEAVIRVVKEISPAVVSIVATKDIPIIKRRFDVFEDPFGFQFQVPRYEEGETEKQEVGGGSGFIVSSDGMVLTNRHVVEDETADYVIFTNDGESFEAEIVARDPIQDLAIMQIKEGDDFPKVKFGDSDKAVIGQTVIAIGNALGEFENTVSVGVISGLNRTINVSDGQRAYIFEKVIQTDAAINRGNSGGPLLNLKGEVVGVNAAMAIGAQNIGFSIPINKAKKMIESILIHGEIVYPFLGVRYLIVDSTLQKENDLPVDYGAWIIRGERGETAIAADSAAQKAGLKENDIILEFNGQKITRENSLAQIILEYNPGDKVILKILRDEEERIIEAVLGKRTGD